VVFIEDGEGGFWSDLGVVVVERGRGDPYISILSHGNLSFALAGVHSKRMYVPERVSRGMEWRFSGFYVHAFGGLCGIVLLCVTYRSFEFRHHVSGVSSKLPCSSQFTRQSIEVTSSKEEQVVMLEDLH
jgi:hypothetical protein